MIPQPQFPFLITPRQADLLREAINALFAVGVNGPGPLGATQKANEVLGLQLLLDRAQFPPQPVAPDEKPAAVPPPADSVPSDG